MVSGLPDNDALSDLEVRVAMSEMWPGATYKVVSFISGVMVSATIWNFVVEISVSTNSVVYGEKNGQAKMSFSLVMPGSKAHIIKTANATNIHVVRAFIQYCKMYMNGVMMSIESSADQPEVKEVDIFR